MRITEVLKHWLFQRELLPVREVTVPHDWAIYGPFDRENDNQTALIFQDGENKESEHNGRTGGLPHTGRGEYSCTIQSPSGPARRVYLDFDGVMSHAKVYINDVLAGERNYGYSSFRVDATAFLKPGSDENSVRVTVENPAHSSRWYPGAGIYRPVRRVETDPVHFAHWGIHLQYLEEEGVLLLEAAVENHTTKTLEGSLFAESPLFAPVMEKCQITSEGTFFRKKVSLKKHEKWGPDSPVLYDVHFRLEAGEYRDEESLKYGIRTARFDAEKGFFLNGENLKLKGVCLHHDLGPIGAAFNRAAAKRQLEQMRRMGCNAVRTSHNPPAPQFLDLCDELGFLVMDEAFDCWAVGKLENDYHKHFHTDAEMDLCGMVRRDRNHPCVILWSIGNEVMEIYDPASGGPEIAQRLCEMVKSVDTERPVSMGLNVTDPQMETVLAIQSQLDVPGWNYQPQAYPFFRRHFPGKAMVGAETMSTLTSRGIYYFPAREYTYYVDRARDTAGDLQCSSYALDSAAWSTLPDVELIAQEDCDYVAGQFIWTGSDYLGEPSPYNSQWPARSSYFGCIDLVGLPKDIFYLVQSCWLKDGPPMVHIVPHHWNWEAGKVLDIHVFSNCDSVELFLNDRSLGQAELLKKSSELYRRLRFIWKDVCWERGILKAVGKRKGKICAEEVLQTSGKPYRLFLSSERVICHGDGEDMLFVTVSVLDEYGVPCPDADVFVKFRLSGDAFVIRAADGGNAASLELFHKPECTLFSGKAVVYLQSTGVSGSGELTAECVGLCSASIQLSAE